MGVVVHGAGFEGPERRHSFGRLSAEDDGGGGFSQIQPQTLQVEGAAGVFRDGFERLKSAHGEAAGDIGARDDGIVVATRLQQPLRCDHRRDARDAGVAHRERFALEAQGPGDMLCGLCGADALFAVGVQQLDVAFGGAEDEQGALACSINLAAAHRFAGGAAGQRFESRHALAGHPGCLLA